MAGEFELSYAGVPFSMDFAKILRINIDQPAIEAGNMTPPRKYQPKGLLLDEIDRMIDRRWLQEFAPPPNYPGYHTSALARYGLLNDQPNSTSVGVGEWYYPNTASRWSVFRGLMTSTQVRQVLQIVSEDVVIGSSREWIPASFVMQANPSVVGNMMDDPDYYSLQSQLYLLPPRPIGETAGNDDGLYLITLVDERYYWQFKAVSIKPNRKSTWDGLILSIGQVLGLDLAGNYSKIPDLYGFPEMDSQLWTNLENIALLFDAVAANVGKVVCRALNGEYTLQTPNESQSIAYANRGRVSVNFIDKMGFPVLDEGSSGVLFSGSVPFSFTKTVYRTAGGDIFASGNEFTKTMSGTLLLGRSAAVPANVAVTFPLYVTGDDPVPHFVNTRYTDARPSSWFEESFGDTANFIVPITSGGPSVGVIDGEPPPIGAPTGVPDCIHFIHDTAKALIGFEEDIERAETNEDNLDFYEVVQNGDQIAALAVQLAGDYYNTQLGAAFDEVYPGTMTWRPEGSHDILWTFSLAAGGGFTRAMRTEWNQYIREFQHALPLNVDE